MQNEKFKMNTSSERGASRSCRWLLPLLPLREERGGERRAFNSAKLPLSPTLSPSDGAREKLILHFEF
jgi:hypothetical protein